MLRRICEIIVALDFIFRLVHCSPEDVSFNIICLDLLEGIEQFYSLMWFKKYRLESPFQSDVVTAFIKTSNCENLDLYYLTEVQQITAFAVFFWFSVTKQSFGFGFPNDQKCTRYLLGLKPNVTLVRRLCLVTLFF